jgi:hypothetical protein
MDAHVLVDNQLLVNYINEYHSNPQIGRSYHLLKLSTLFWQVQPQQPTRLEENIIKWLIC